MRLPFFLLVLFIFFQSFVLALPARTPSTSKSSILQLNEDPSNSPTQDGALLVEAPSTPEPSIPGPSRPPKGMKRKGSSESLTQDGALAVEAPLTFEPSIPGPPGPSKGKKRKGPSEFPKVNLGPDQVFKEGSIIENRESKKKFVVVNTNRAKENIYGVYPVNEDPSNVGKTPGGVNLTFDMNTHPKMFALRKYEEYTRHGTDGLLGQMQESYLIPILRAYRKDYYPKQSNPKPPLGTEIIDVVDDQEVIEVSD